MIEQPDQKRLQHILDASLEITQFTEDTTKDDFLNSRLLQRAVEKDLEIVGEAASQLDDETLEKFPSIPWKDIIGMRNILIHVYFEVDLETVWNTIEEDIPSLINELEDEI